MQRIDTEWLALRAGVKPGLRLAADATTAPEVRARFERLGCAVAVAHGRIGLERRERVLLYIGATPQVAAGLRAAERHLLVGETSDHDKAFFTRELGLRLGYPRCCVDAFAERTRRGGGRLRAGDRDKHDPDYVHAHEARVARPDWRLNNLLLRHHVRLISFAPCRFDCLAALAQAREIHRLAVDEAPAAVPVLEAMLRRPLAIGPDGARAWVSVTAGRITTAEPPREPPDGPTEATDRTHAAAWLSAAVVDGQLQDRGEPRPLLLDFSLC